MVSSEKVLLLKFFGTSFGIKCISYYLIPGLAMGSTYEDTTNFTYLKVAIVLYFILNFANQFLHTQKYKQKVLHKSLLLLFISILLSFVQIKLLGMKYIIGTLIGIAVYTFVAFSFGAYLVKCVFKSLSLYFGLFQRYFGLLCYDIQFCCTRFC